MFDEKMIFFPHQILGDCTVENYRIKRGEDHLEQFRSESGLFTKIKRDSEVYYQYNVQWKFNGEQFQIFEFFYVDALKEGSLQFVMHFLTGSGYEPGICRFDGVYEETVAPDKNNRFVKAKLLAHGFEELGDEYKEGLLNMNMSLEDKYAFLDSLHALVHIDLFKNMAPNEVFYKEHTEKFSIWKEMNDL